MQLSFSFPMNIDIYDVRNFIVHNGNRDIFDFVTSSLLINNNIYLLTGVKSSGKTYICNIWKKLKGATFINSKFFKMSKENFVFKLENEIKNGEKYILEDIENFELKEEYFLYLLNTIIEKKAILLITSKKYIYDFNFHMPDLSSRFKNIINFVMKDLNDESKQKIILKLLTDKQMNIDYDILLYISKKISGNYSEILNFVNNLENIIKDNKIKRINVNIIKNLL